MQGKAFVHEVFGANACCAVVTAPVSSRPGAGKKMYILSGLEHGKAYLDHAFTTLYLENWEG